MTSTVHNYVVQAAAADIAAMELPKFTPHLEVPIAGPALTDPEPPPPPIKTTFELGHVPPIPPHPDYVNAHLIDRLKKMGVKDDKEKDWYWQDTGTTLEGLKDSMDKVEAVQADLQYAVMMIEALLATQRQLCNAVMSENFDFLKDWAAKAPQVGQEAEQYLKHVNTGMAGYRKKVWIKNQNTTDKKSSICLNQPKQKWLSGVGEVYVDGDVEEAFLIKKPFGGLWEK